MLKTKVKAGNITNLSDARYCAGMGVEWLGFPAKSVDPKTFVEITGWVSGPRFVLELGAGALIESVLPYPVSILQIGYDQIEGSQLFSGDLIVTVPLADWGRAESELLSYRKRIQCVLITYLTGEQTVDSDLLKEVTAQFDVLIDLEGCPYPLAEILNFPIAGVNIAGNQELKPGLKEYGELAEVLEQLEGE